MPSELLRLRKILKNHSTLEKKKINARKSKKRKQQCIGDALSWPSSPSLWMAITEGPRETTGKRRHRIGRALADPEKRGVYEREDFFVCIGYVCVQEFSCMCVVCASAIDRNLEPRRDFIQLSKLHDSIMQRESEDEENLDSVHQRKAIRVVSRVPMLPVSQSKR